MVKIFYDSLCPVCSKEINMLKRLDKKQRIEFVDITSTAFNPAQYGKTIDDFVGTIHGQREDGSIVTGMSVFRMVYKEVGLGWLFAWTSWPILRPCTDYFYNLFAKIRPRFSSFDQTCDSGRCKIHKVS